MVADATSRLSAKDAAKRVRLKYALLDAWARGRDPVLAPDVSGGGRGKRREYVYRDLVALRVADELRLIGVRTSVIRAVVRHVQNEVKRIDTADQVQDHPGAWVAVMCRSGRVVQVFSVADPAKVKQAALDGVTVFVDVIALARGLVGRRSTHSRSSLGRERR